MALQQLAFQQQQSSAYAAQLAAEALGSKGLKRSSDDTFDSFVEDMKKRKMEPVYDVDMISRLNSLMPPGMPLNFPLGGSNLPSFGAPSLPFGFSSLGGLGGLGATAAVPMPIPDIRTEADLALFNQFMVSLGREATALPMEATSSSGTTSSQSRNSLSPTAGSSPIEDLFNPAELASLGLAGMPGIPTGSSSLPGSGVNAGVSLGSLYPSLDGLTSEGRPRAASASEAAEPHRNRPIAGLPRAGSTSSQTRNQLAGSYAGLAQYAQMPGAEWLAHGAHGQGNEQNFASFDSLARARNSVPAATLAPRDFYKRTYRHIAPLGAAPRESAERTGADEEDEPSDESDEGTPEPPHAHAPRIPVTSLLVDADPNLTLPAFGDKEGRTTTLPPIRMAAPIVAVGRRAISPARHPPVKRHTDDQLVHGVKRLELEDRTRGDSPADSVATTPSRPSTARPSISERERERDQESRERETTVTPRSERTERTDRDPAAGTRRRHAALIRAWLVSVNLEFKRRQIQLLSANAPARDVPRVEIAA
jgi:hypothetical protein